jgi:hypothetical protein
MMVLQQPFIISARLLPAIKIADCTISLERRDRDSEGRWMFRIYFDFKDGRKFVEDTLRSGCGGIGGGTQEMFETLFSFLTWAGEAAHWRQLSGCESENEDLFCPEITEWCEQNNDDISCLACDIKEKKGLIVDA